MVNVTPVGGGLKRLQVGSSLRVGNRQRWRNSAFQKSVSTNSSPSIRLWATVCWCRCDLVQQPEDVSNDFLHDNPANNDPSFVVRPALSRIFALSWVGNRSSRRLCVLLGGQAWREDAGLLPGRPLKGCLFPGRLVSV